MTREETLRSYTRDAAWAVFEEDWKGTLSPGHVADMVVLSADLMSVPASDISDIDVLATIVGGRVVYSAKRQRDDQN